MDKRVLAREQRAATTRPERVSFLSAPLLLSSSPLPFCHYGECLRESEKIEKPREEEDQTHPLLLLPTSFSCIKLISDAAGRSPPVPPAAPPPPPPPVELTLVLALICFYN